MFPPVFPTTASPDFTTVDGLTPNSIPYADAAGVLTENNPGLTYNGVTLVVTTAAAAGDGLSIVLGTNTSSAGLTITEDNVARGGALISLTRQPLATAQALIIQYDGVGDAIGVVLGTGLANQAMVVTEDNVIRTTSMLQMTRQASATGSMVQLTNAGEGDTISLNVPSSASSTAHGIDITNGTAGSGHGVNISVEGSGTGAQAMAIADTTDVTRTTPLVSIARGADHTAAALAVTYSAATDAMTIALDTNLGSQALVVTEDNVVRTAAMVELTRQANATGDVLLITNAGSGNSINVASGAVAFADDVALVVGTGSDSSVQYNTAQTTDALYVGVGADSNGMVIAQEADKTFDFAHGLATNPTLFIHSASQSTTEWISLTHDQTCGLISSGTDGFRILTAGTTIVFHVDSGITQIYSTIQPNTTNSRDLGTNSLLFRDSYVARTITANQIAVAAAAGPKVVDLNTGAHTALTASTEYVAFDFDNSATQQFATGALATQRGVLFQAPTYGFVGASVITDAATVAISGAPVAGTNATITNPYALWVQGGKTLLAGDLQHDGANLGFYQTAAIAQQTGVAVTDAAIHAACVALGLFTA